jgi:REP element-mobilizing transposase RayT
MARPLRIQYPGAYYHLTCRGNDRNRIFGDDKDRARFLKLLENSLDVYQVNLYSYVLMTNHFHLLIQTPLGNLSEFMRHFNVCYTGYYNYRHGRSGHLYQGRYKSFLIDVDNYLLEVSRYLHLNVVRVHSLRTASLEEKVNLLENYKWSSLPGYISKKKIEKFVKYDLILSMIGSRANYYKFIIEGLDKDLINPFKEIRNGGILGGDKFIKKIKEEQLEYGSSREQPGYKELISDYLQPEKITEIVVNTLEVDKEILLERYKNGITRGILSEMLYRYSGLKEAEIGKLLGNIDYSAVNRLRSRLKKKMEKEFQIKLIFERIGKQIRENLSNVEI